MSPFPRDRTKPRIAQVHAIDSTTPSAHTPDYLSVPADDDRLTSTDFTLDAPFDPDCALGLTIARDRHAGGDGRDGAIPALPVYRRHSPALLFATSS